MVKQKGKKKNLDPFNLSLGEQIVGILGVKARRGLLGYPEGEVLLWRRQFSPLPLGHQTGKAKKGTLGRAICML